MEILPRPDGHEEQSGPEMWVDESIWGHRLHDEQTPWLTFLEFLGVLHAEYRQGRALSEEAFNTLAYRPQTQLRLRNLLFNNPYLETVRTTGLSDEAMWAQWRALIEANAGGLDKPDFSYVRSRFETFEDFAAVVSFLRSSAIEGGSNKRWSSKFVFPFGTNALYEDLKVRADSVSIDRRFFARAGEVLYLMLCRSRRADDLRDRLVRRVLEGEPIYGHLVSALQGEDQLARNERAGAYLPCSTHAVFDQLAEDWISLLDLDVPAYDAFPHIVVLIGLHVLRYQLQRSQEALGANEPVRFVCEIVAPQKTVVRELSADSYQGNNTLPQRALKRFIRQTETAPEWIAALELGDPERCRAYLADAFDFGEPEEARRAPGAMLDEFERRALVRHKQHVGKIHGVWSRNIGLSSRRASRRLRYAPTDRLLKSLVVCCVDERLEFKDFLRRLYDRYGLIIGDQQAGQYIGGGRADQEDFSENASRLEERLASLGLLRRLSDSCAYVENPFKRMTSS